MRSGGPQYQSSKSQSFQARMQATPRWRSVALKNTRTAEARDLRGEVHRRPHPVDVPCPGSGPRCVATRSHLIGSGTAPGCRSPDDVRPPRSCPPGCSAVLELPHLVSLGGLDDPRSPLASAAGRRPSKCGRFHHVVVDRDHRDRRRGGSGRGGTGPGRSSETPPSLESSASTAARRRTNFWILPVTAWELLHLNT